jgi:hypothetical protein
MPKKVIVVDWDRQVAILPEPRPGRLTTNERFWCRRARVRSIAVLETLCQGRWVDLGRRVGVDAYARFSCFVLKALAAGWPYQRVMTTPPSRVPIRQVVLGLLWRRVVGDAVVRH